MRSWSPSLTTTAAPSIKRKYSKLKHCRFTDQNDRINSNNLIWNNDLKKIERYEKREEVFRKKKMGEKEGGLNRNEREGGEEPWATRHLLRKPRGFCLVMGEIIIIWIYVHMYNI